jgi:WhiB family redox-sensing transcriptional regulator
MRTCVRAIVCSCLMFTLSTGSVDIITTLSTTLVDFDRGMCLGTVSCDRIGAPSHGHIPDSTLILPPLSPGSVMLPSLPLPASRIPRGLTRVLLCVGRHRAIGDQMRGRHTVPNADMDWMQDAACQGKPSKLFFPGPGQGYEEGKRICYGCQVRQDCLNYAMVVFPQADDEHGMWGGKTPAERRKMKRRQRKLAAAGTASSGIGD